jgi:tetratricopeptide (TPR) repeat protein
MRSFSLLWAMLLCGQVALAAGPAEKAVVIREVELKTAGSPVTLSPGTTLTVEGTEGDRLKVSVGRVGTVDPTALISAKDADGHFSELVAKNADDAAALRARGKLRFDKAGLNAEQLDAAIADFDASLKFAPSSEALTLRGFAYKRKGDPEKAMADLEAAIKLNPKEALAWRVRGATWASKGDYQKAVADYSESIRIDPENPDSLHHRVMLLSCCEVDDIRNGKQAIEDATKACEVSGWKSPLYLQGLALAFAEAGDYDSAIKWQTKLAEEYGTGKDLVEQFRQKKPVRRSWKK